jgi:hypothetical protein
MRIDAHSGGFYAPGAGLGKELVSKTDTGIKRRGSVDGLKTAAKSLILMT